MHSQVMEVDSNSFRVFSRIAIGGKLDIFFFLFGNEFDEIKVRKFVLAEEDGSRLVRFLVSKQFLALAVFEFDKILIRCVVHNVF